MAYTKLTTPITRADGKIGAYIGASNAGKAVTVDVRKEGNTNFATASFVRVPKTGYIVDGDSMSAVNSGMTQADTWSGHLQPTLDANNWAMLHNSAVGGETIADMLSNVATQVDAKKDLVNYERNVVFCLMGINSLYRRIHMNGMTAQAAFEATIADLTTYHVGRVNAGFHTVAFTITATQSGGYAASLPAIEQARQLFNNWVRANWRGVLRASVLVDLDADPELGGYDAVLNTTYYQSDKIHWTQAGRKKAAEVIRLQLLNIPASAPTGTIDQDVSSLALIDENEFERIGYFSSTGLASAWQFSADAGLGLVGPSAQHRYSQDAQAAYELTAYTDSFVIRSAKLTNGASFRVLVDGVEHGFGNCYASPQQPSQVVYRVSGLPLGAHTLRVEKVGESGFLCVDAVYVSGSGLPKLVAPYTGYKAIEQGSTSYVNVGSWTVSSNALYLGGSAHTNGTVGSTKTIQVRARVIEFLTASITGAGTIQMQVKRISDGAVVSTQAFNHGAAGANRKSGWPDENTPQLTYTAPAEDSFEVEFRNMGGGNLAVAVDQLRIRL